MDPIKEAFTKAKQDMISLQSQVNELKNSLEEIKRTLNTLLIQQTNKQLDKSAYLQTNDPDIQAERVDIRTNQRTENFKMPLNDLKSNYSDISIGNDGVPTNKQTNQQTDRHIGNKGVNLASVEPKKTSISQLERVSDVLASLGSLKKEVRHKFKKLTKQEMTVFSTIYTLENQGFIVDYSLISQKMALSESSIREYIQKIISKGIPIEKIKENNKKILLKIDENLKKIASLEVIQDLRAL